MVIVGFSGTSAGTTHAQRQALVTLLDDTLVTPYVDEFHHGGCVGADQEAAALARWLGYKLVRHPAVGVDPRKIAEKIEGERVLRGLPPLDRNRDIVDVCHVLFTTPHLDREEQRSGTWATIRYARKVGREHAIVWPDGQIERSEVRR